MRHKHRYPLDSVKLPVFFLYTDAEGNGGIGGCLCSADGDTMLRHVFAARLDKRFTGKLEKRLTQIMAFEAMAVSVGIETFKGNISGAKCVYLIDNLSVLGSVKKGRCKARDIHNIVRVISDRILHLNIFPIFLWVPSRFNLADAPSRGLSVAGFQQVDCKKGIVAAMANLCKQKHTIEELKMNCVPQ